MDLFDQKVYRNLVPSKKGTKDIIQDERSMKHQQEDIKNWKDMIRLSEKYGGLR